jgi:hypothetical protein
MARSRNSFTVEDDPVERSRQSTARLDRLSGFELGAAAWPEARRSLRCAIARHR